MVEAATQVLPVFAVDAWAVRWIVAAAVIGFPFGMAFAWLYEWTPAGIVRESEIAPGASVAHLTGKRLDRGIIAVLALMLVLLLANKFVLHREGGQIAEKSIAVLPLVNESGDPDTDYFSDGLSEELITALAQNRGLKVIGRGSSFRFKGNATDSATIGRKLGVGTLLEGTVRRQAGRVRISIALVDAATGRQSWSQTYDRELKDIFALQSEIARAVADSLQVTLIGTATNAPRAVSTLDVGAHNAYLQGHFHLERNSFESWHKAVGFYDEAIRRDPNYALAYAERARAAARSNAERSVALGPALAEAHAALGWVRLYIDWNFAGAVTELRRAEQLAPGSATANYQLSQVLLYMGQVEEGTTLARQAVELDPLAYAARNNLARALTVSGHYPEAEAQGRKAAELQPDAVAAHRWQVIGAVLRGDPDTALREAALETSQASVRGPTQGFRHFEFALAYYTRGDRAQADAALAELIAKDSDSMAYQIAEVYAWRGETDPAFEWLQRAFDTRDPGTLGTAVDPLLLGLRGDARFVALVEKLGLAESVR